jgi:enoyl-CoA hydratase/carnithine racemase
MSNPPAAGTVKAERDGAVAILTISFPERRNALAAPVRVALQEHLQAAMADRDVRAVVLTGDGEHFCSGGDVSSFNEDVSPPEMRARMQRLHALTRLIIRGETPVIAAVEGFAAGAGLCVAAACDIVVAARTARFMSTFNKVGMFADFGGVWSLPARMGLGRAKLLMMSGRPLDAEAAERQGLVDLVAEPGQALKEALALAHDIAKTAPLSNGYIKAVLAQGPRSLEEVMAAEADAQGVLAGTEDFAEGVRAFLEKRTPKFQAR